VLTFTKYCLSMADMAMEGRWEGKGVAGERCAQEYTASTGSSLPLSPRRICSSLIPSPPLISPST
jgi:hypothetical protein